MQSYVIGIDIGTSSTKAVAISYTGDTLFAYHVSYSTIHPKVGWHEQVPELIWQAFIKCISEVIKNLKHEPTSISLSSAMHSLIPVDEKGNAVRNMITWADKRSAAIAEDIRLSALGKMLYEENGTPIHAMSPLCKIIWLKDNEPHIFHSTYKFISIKEFIWIRLFGVFEIDHSIASATGLFNILNKAWNHNALSLALIDSDKLSQPVSTSYYRVINDVSIQSQLGVAENTIFVIGASDGCLANLGSFSTTPGVAALTIGTSGAIRVAATKPTYNFEAMTFNYILDENTFIAGGPVNNGGVALKWYVESFLKKSLNATADYLAILQEIETVKAGSNDLVFLPYLLGERAPIWNCKTCGVFFGITLSHEQAHFTRAVVEGITFALYHVATELEKSGMSINSINVSGGFVNSKIWLQLLADIFNKKVCLINQEDASAIGAAYLAMKSLGIIQNFGDLKRDHQKEYHPNANQHNLYQQSFARYKRLYNILQHEMTLTAVDERTI